MTKIEREQIKKNKELEYLCPKRNFVKPIIEDLFAKKKRIGKLVFGFDLGGGVPQLKPPSLKGCIHVCSCHLLELINSHIVTKKVKK